MARVRFEGRDWFEGSWDECAKHLDDCYRGCDASKAWMWCFEDWDGEAIPFCQTVRTFRGTAGTGRSLRNWCEADGERSS